MTGLPMEGKTCLVTGATDGHGKAVAHELAALGADVIVHGRSREKTLETQAEIARANAGKAPEVILADLSSRSEIDAAVESYLASGRPLDVLVNNAGLVGLSRRTNDEGLELTFAVNYLAQFRLTLGLLPRMRESVPARIVNISSDTYKIARLDFDDLQLEQGYGMMKAYGQSKLAILYFTLELSRRLDGERISVNAVDPGPVASNIGADNPGLAYRLVGPMIQSLFPSAARAARSAIRVATEPGLESASGGYYRSRKLRKKPLDFDPETSRRLWEMSLDMCHFEHDPIG
jgi:NAD(P)-dependent dehydrogenase (short-subunit alcohol dehydrogenase family)